MTLDALIKEAEKNHKEAERRFRKYDNCDDMHDSETWARVVAWLKEKKEKKEKEKK